MNNDRFTTKVKAYQATAAFVGFGLAVISAIFTIKLLVSFGNSGFEKVLYGTFGALIQSAQTCSYVFACYALWIQGNKGRAITGFSLFGLLCLLSLCGSIGMFVVSNQRANAEINAGSGKKSSIADEVKAIDSQIAELNAQVKDYTARGIITKGAKPASERIDRLQEKRSALAAEMRGVDVPKDDPDALYNTIATFFNTDVQSAKTTLYILYSIALELSSVILLSFSMLMFGRQESAAVRTIESNRPVLPDNRQPERSGVRQTEPDKPAFIPQPAFDEPQQYKDFRLWEKDAEEKKRPVGFTFTEKSCTPSVKPESDDVLRTSSEIDGVRTHSRTEKFDLNAYVKQSDTPLKQEIARTSSETDHVRIDVRKKTIKPELDLLLKYIRTAFANLRDGGHFQTRYRLAEHLEISQNKARQIHEWLKENGFFTVSDAKTFPAMPESEMLSRLGGAA